MLKHTAKGKAHTPTASQAIVIEPRKEDRMGVDRRQTSIPVSRDRRKMERRGGFIGQVGYGYGGK